jgi:hypothetical protein
MILCVAAQRPNFQILSEKMWVDVDAGFDFLKITV